MLNRFPAGSVPEITTENEPEQFDLFEDRRAQLRRLRIASVQRLTLTRVADVLGKDPSTVANWLSGADPSKRASADLHDVCWVLDPVYRRDCTAVMGEVLSRPPDLSPEQAMREVAALATSGEFGNGSKEKVFAIYRRMRRGDE